MEFQPILAKYGLSILLGLLSGFLKGQSVSFADEIPKTPTAAGPDLQPTPQSGGSALVPTLRPSAGHAFGVLSVRFICVVAASSRNPLAIGLAIADCITISIVAYLNDG